MPDLTSDLLPGLYSHRLPGLDLGDGFIYPHYEGWSILNVPTSICQWLGVPEMGVAPLDPKILASIGDRYQQVVLVLVDALSLNRLRKSIREGNSPVWERLAEDGVLAPLTSITPSTTASALTSLWTGKGVLEHGIVGYEMWLKEYGIVANAILQAPMSFRGDTGSLRRAGFTPENFINQLLLGTHLASYGVRTIAFQHHSIARSGLSRMLLQEVNVIPYRTLVDLWVNVLRTITDNSSERKYIWIYWGDLDYFSHHYGPDDERTIGEFVAFAAAFEKHFLNGLETHDHGDTLLIFLADHGQINTHPARRYDLRYHTGLVRSLHIMPTGENRLAYLYLRPDQGNAPREYIERTWPEQFSFLNPVTAVESGLFGSGKHHPRLFERLGDLIIVAQENAYLWWSHNADHLLGRHGGLSPEEMLVPFLAVDL
jgi:hypothetical protein